AIVRYFSWAAGGFVLLLLLTAPLRGEPWYVVGSYAALLGVFVASLSIQRRAPHVAGALTSLGPLVLVVALTWARGGINSPPGLAALATLVALSGLFWGGPGAFLIAGLSSLSVAWFVYLGESTPGMSGL